MALCYTLIEMRLRMIEDILSKKRQVNEVAEIMWVSRKTVHKWKCRYEYYWVAWLLPEKSWPKAWRCWNRTDKEIEEKVMEYGNNYKKEWPVRLSMRLEEECGIKIDQSTIYRILKRRNIRYYMDYSKEKKIRKKKATLYVLDNPWREVQLDTSFPYGRRRKLVIYSAIDDCTRKVYSKAYRRHWLNSTKRFIAELRKNSEYKIETIRTDQWSEFSNSISLYLESRWINHIKNEAYHPEHNGKVERYHRTMKEESISKWREWIWIEEANYQLRQWMAYYNRKRKHTWLWMNWLTPEQKLKNVTLILQ